MSLPLFDNKLAKLIGTGRYIRWNGLCVPTDHIEAMAARCVKPLIFGDEDETGRYSHVGSCCIVRQKNKTFVLSTKHQCKHHSSDAVRVFIPELGENCLPLNLISFADDVRLNDDRRDIFCFRVAKELTGPYLHHAAEICDERRNSKDLIYLVAATPNYEDVMKYDPDRIDIKTVTCTADLSEVNSAFRSLELRILKQPEQFIYDGFSGGGVFRIHGDVGDLAMDFDGVVVRGGNNRFHYIDISFISRLIQNCC